MVTYVDIAASHVRIMGAAPRTPALTSSTADALIVPRPFFQSEHLPRHGAVKFRRP